MDGYNDSGMNPVPTTSSLAAADPLEQRLREGFAREAEQISIDGEVFFLRLSQRLREQGQPRSPHRFWG